MKDNGKDNNGFSYTYSAREQEEIRKIREKYAPPTETEDKMARLRRLDASVTAVAQSVSLAFGVIGVLILGFGMSLLMSELGELLGIGRALAIIIGISVGLAGGVLLAFAYPVYNAIVRAKREKLAPEIIRLSDELMR